MLIVNDGRTAPQFPLKRMVCKALQKANAIYILATLAVVLLVGVWFLFTYCSWWVISCVAAVIAVPVGMGLLEIFVFGDNPAHKEE